MKYEKQLATVLSACLALSVTLTPLAADLPQTDKNSQGNVAAANDQEKTSKQEPKEKKADSAADSQKNGDNKKEKSATANSPKQTTKSNKSGLEKVQEQDAGKFEVVWKTPVVVYGAALSINEISRTRELFGLGNVNALSETSVDSRDLYRYLGSSAVDGDMISSVAVQKREKGFGVRVKIVTPSMITQITDAMYTNAAISAGVSDCQILVASTRPVTGESALAGVYKAFALKGETFNSKQMQVSQAELNTVNAINQSNAKVKGYNKAYMDKVILDTKLAMQKRAGQLGTGLAAGEITKIINANLSKYGLGNIVKSNQVEALTKLFERFQNTDAINSPVVQQQLQILSSKLQTVFDQFYQDAKKAGFWDRIVKFVTDVWDTIMDSVNKLSK
jgi:hypothetical protein